MEQTDLFWPNQVCPLMICFPSLPSPPPTHFTLPVKMGVPVFALTDTLETAADLASRSGGKQELVQLLRAVEGKTNPP